MQTALVTDTDALPDGAPRGGGVTNLGSQAYAVSGGQVAYAEIGGMTLNPGATIQYNFTATQNGMTTEGSGSIYLAGTTATGGVVVPISARATFSINGAEAGAVVGQSELPFVFLTSTSNFQVTVGGIAQTIPEILSIESPYFNPWGAPIVMASPDGAIVIVATYAQGTILWTGTQVAGPVVGTLGTTPAAGIFTLTSGELENLVQGTAVDSGAITFSAMTPASLDASGFYTGPDTIPYPVGTSPYPAGPPAPWDCSPMFGIPGTCTETGFQSIGQFRAPGMSGTYSTAWGVPAFEFNSTITATVTQSASASAVNGRLSSSGSLCTSNGGTWFGSADTCTIASGTTWTIGASATMFISSGVTLVNDGTILNSGNIVNNGAITNDGVTFYNGNSGPTGTLTNNGIFTNEAGVTFNNFATFANSASGTVDNYGTYVHHTGGSMNNYGIYFNFGNTHTHTNTFDDYGVFANMGSGTVSNSGGATLTQECGGQMVNLPDNTYSQVQGCRS